ncbi:uncharacterized protein LOC105837676 [Monomorium pharaonis]|uniref:uncharacterized protein LOC105837676 n=1 Tax=Monomorium pharaonis TaxID=307658 RepID=UPI0017468C29|nr:uncharacterized protein LOC105837676 [Monomorium pharaonis]
MIYYEMEMFVKQGNEETNITLQHYVDNYKHIYGSYILFCYLGAIGIICGPLFLADEFPAPAKYPFSIEHFLMKSIIYLQQSLVAFQTVAAISVDYNIAILLLYCAARIELLTQKIRNVKNERELNMCIKLHNEILRYVNEVISVIRPIMFITIMTTAMAVIFGSLNLVTEQPIIVKIQYASIVLIAGTVLFACSLPADKLMHTSSKICLGAYESQWFEGSVSMQKKIIQIIFRAQKSEVISITGILPALTLRYYAGFLYSSLSYFTAVRIMISRD